MMRGMQFALAGLLLAGLLGCTKEEEQSQHRGPQAFPVSVEAVTTRKVEYTIPAVGSLDAYEEVSIVARVGGVVEKVTFLEGDRVKAGATLALIDPERFRANRQIALAQLKQAEAIKDEAVRAYERRSELAGKDKELVSQEELQTYRTKAASAKAQWMKAKAELDLAELNLRDAQPRAPIDGVVQSRLVHTGQYVQPGTLVAKMLRESPLLLRFQVTDEQASRIGDDSKVYFLSNGKQHEAAIIHVAGAANENRMVSVVAEVQHAAPGLRPGTFAEVRVVTARSRNAAVIPQTAVRPSEHGLIVFVAENETARQRKIQAGMRTADGMLEVLEGLEAGERLIIRGSDALRDGAPIQVIGGNEKTSRPIATPESAR